MQSNVGFLFVSLFPNPFLLQVKLCLQTFTATYLAHNKLFKPL